MNQPQLGLKVSELRQQKGLTQEQLAERCEVSARTIQRIESGEVDPRAYTLHCLGEVLDFDFGAEDPSNENLWLTVLHLSSILVILIIPLVLWSWKKDKSYKINQQGRQVLNFQITMTLMLFAAAFLLALFPTALIFIGEQTVDAIENSTIFLLATLCLPMPLILIGFFCTYQGVVNAVRALSDRPIHYALSIPFVK
jgi:uncharacterized Tic20 family protein